MWLSNESVIELGVGEKGKISFPVKYSPLNLEGY